MKPNYDNISLRTINKLETSSEILKALSTGIAQEVSVKSLYMDAFVNACIHALSFDNHCLVNTCFDKVPNTSIYRSHIKRWIERETCLVFSKSKQAFIRKTVDNKKVSWNVSQINSLINNPFYEKSTVETEESYTIDTYFKSINKLNNLARLTIKKFEESSLSSDISNNIAEIEENEDLTDSDKELAVAFINDNTPFNISIIQEALKLITVELSKTPGEL